MNHLIIHIRHDRTSVCPSVVQFKWWELAKTVEKQNALYLRKSEHTSLESSLNKIVYVNWQMDNTAKYDHGDGHFSEFFLFLHVY